MKTHRWLNLRNHLLSHLRVASAGTLFLTAGALAFVAVRPSSAVAPTYNINTLAGKLASVNGTAGLGIPGSIAMLAWGGVALRRGSRHPVFLFFVVSAALTLVLDVIWAAVHGGRLVEPCSVLGC